MSLALKPNHAAVKAYYDTLQELGQLHFDHEGAVRKAFSTLLDQCGRKATPKLTLVPEYRIERARSSVIVDGAMVDSYHLPTAIGKRRTKTTSLADSQNGNSSFVFDPSDRPDALGANNTAPSLYILSLIDENRPGKSFRYT